MTRELARLAWPLALAGQLLFLDSANTRYWLGRFVGPEGLAVHATTQPALMLVQLLFLAIAAGCGVAVARSVGARDGRALSIATSAVGLMAAMWMIVLAVVLPLSGSIAAALAEPGVPAASIRELIDAWVITTVPTFALVYLLVATAGSAGMTRFALAQSALHLAMVVGLVPLFLGPLDLGYPGAAYALSIAAAINCVFLWSMLRRRLAQKLGARASARDILDRSHWRGFLDVGLPQQLTRFGTYVMFLLLTVHVAGDGAAAVAGYGIALILMWMAGVVSGAMAQATSIVIAQRLGAGDRGAARRALRVSLWVGSLWLPTATSIVLLVGGAAAVSVFSDRPDVTQQGVRAVHLLVLSLFPAGCWQTLLASFAAARATKRAMVLGVIAEAIALPTLLLTSDRMLGAAIALTSMYVLSALLLGALAIRVLWRRALADPVHSR